jgi:hypothetical protein
MENWMMAFIEIETEEFKAVTTATRYDPYGTRYNPTQIWTTKSGEEILVSSGCTPLYRRQPGERATAPFILSCVRGFWRIVHPPIHDICDRVCLYGRAYQVEGRMVRPLVVASRSEPLNPKQLVQLSAWLRQVEEDFIAGREIEPPEEDFIAGCDIELSGAKRPAAKKRFAQALANRRPLYRHR